MVGDEHTNRCTQWGGGAPARITCGESCRGRARRPAPTAPASSPARATRRVQRRRLYVAPARRRRARRRPGSRRPRAADLRVWPPAGRHTSPIRRPPSILVGSPSPRPIRPPRSAAVVRSEQGGSPDLGTPLASSIADREAVWALLASGSRASTAASSTSSARDAEPPRRRQRGEARAARRSAVVRDALTRPNARAAVGALAAARAAGDGRGVVLTAGGAAEEAEGAAQLVDRAREADALRLCATPRRPP